MKTIFKKKLKVFPGFKFYVKPAKKKSKNKLALKRNKIDNKELQKEINRFKGLIKND
jgi:hypothetical protein